MALLRRSIIELCVADHKNDPEQIENWLRNKTLETYATWLNSPGLILILAEAERSLAGFAMASRSGEIMLNYVAPDARFRGISTSLLNALETDLFDGGLTRLSLFSTETAHAFYQARGWTDHDAPDLNADVISYPMVKVRA